MWKRDVQETEDIELFDILDTGSGKGKDSPSHLKKSNVKRNVDLVFC